MKPPPTSLVLTLATALLLPVACSVFIVRSTTDRTEVRNLSGQTVRDVVLEVHDHYRNNWSLTRRTASLKPGESLRVRHSHRDTKAVVTFAIAGRSFRHEERYIDLWTGECWRFDIQPGGKVAGGYDYRK